MPIYALGCLAEPSHQFEGYAPKFETPNPPCETCGAETERIWKITKRTGYHRYPYTTTNINGKPMEITDAAHEARVLKEHNLVQRDDVAYLEEEYVGYDPYTDKQVYRHGSGRGLPGQWV